VVLLNARERSRAFRYLTAEEQRELEPDLPLFLQRKLHPPKVSL